MISNFNEVEKSLKRCLKEKVSITAATVVGFLIAGTVAFGGSPTNVTVEGTEAGTITITGVEGSGSAATIARESGKLTVGDIYPKSEVIKSLAGLLTVKVEGTVATITGNYKEDGTYLGDLSITSGAQQGVTFLSTDETVTSITSDLKVDVTGKADKLATAMEATNAEDKVASTGEITVNAHAVGMKANAGATAENKKTDEKTTGKITVEDPDGVGMSAIGEGSLATNEGIIEAKKGIGMLAEDKGTIKNAVGATIEAGNSESTSAGTGMSVTGNGTATNEGTINVNYEGSVGMSATTKAGETAILKNDGTITVTTGTGISVTGDGTAEVKAGKITVEAEQTGIKVAGTGTTNVTGTTIDLKGTGTGINATGNVTLEDIAITLTGAGTGIEYNGGEAVANAKISTGDTELKASGATGIKATMSNQATSTLDITTGSIATTNASAFGIKIAGGGTASTPASGVQKSTAIVTTTLGTTVGTGVEVTGKANYGITVNLENVKTAPATSKTTKTVVSGTGVKIASNEANGGVIVKVNQKDLSVAEGTKLVEVTANDGDVTMDAKQAVELVTTANLVDIGAAGGNITVNLDADGQSVATGSLVNVGAIKGTTNVNINKDVTLADNDGRLVKAAGDLGAGGILNINLNVEGEKGLNVVTGKTALDLSAMSSGTASVKNTGNVTINENGTLLAGSESNAISLTNQGLIDLTTVNGENSAKDSNSKISTGAKVNVANYGTIKLAMTSADFLTAAGKDPKQDTLANLTTEEVAKALKALGVIATDYSQGSFSTIGYIEFNDNESFTTAKALAGEATVAGLASTLAKQPEGEKGFEVKKGDALTLTSESENDKLENVQLNLKGVMTTVGSKKTVVIDNSNSDSQILIREDGKIEVASGTTLNYSGNILASEDGTKPAIEVSGTLTLSNGTLTVEALPAEKNESGIMVANEAPNRVGIKLVKDAEAFVVLDNSTINADIEGTLTSSNELKGTINSTGISAINGTVSDIATIKVENGMLKFGADSQIVVSAGANSGEKTTIDLTAGNMGVQIGENGNNVLKETNSKHLTISGLNTNTPNTSGKVVLLTDALTENTEFNLGNHESLKEGTVITDGDIYYTIVKGDGKWTATFNEDALLEATGTKYLELGNIFVGTQAIHDLLSKDPNVRVAQLDDLYSNNIYSETVKMSLDTLKMNEDAVLSLNVRPKQGEFTAQGKFLFNNTDYDREGVTRDYKVETKNTGLLGAMEYGLTDTSSVGFAFSGTKQDLDMKNGASADGDAFYFGLYRNDTFNNIDLTTGLGYMIDRVDAENFIGKDKFDSTALSGYIQGKYNYAIGENLTLSPKARLTVTRFQQDSVNTGRMKQEEIKDTMADLELGVEVKKGIALETGKMNLLAGASYTTNVAGKDDDFYRVDFLSKTGKANSTRAKGANLEKNSLKLNIGADVELTNGVFYNGGLSYEFDDEDRDSIGVTLGAGYKF